MNLLIGQDTELFLRKGDSFISAYGVIPGSKDKPYPVKRGAVQVDGMALEFNTLPAKTLRQFKININTVLSRLQDMIPDDCEMTVCSTAHFDPEYIENQPIEATTLGCNPDFNAYTGEMNPPPQAIETMRTASGHIHLGWTENKDINDPSHMSDCISLVKQLDYYLGIPAVMHDPDLERKQMYGKAGSFRPKPYGVEYRVLSNYWITRDEYMEEVFVNCGKAVSNLNEGVNWPEFFSSQRSGILSAEEVINTGDSREALKIMRHMHLDKVKNG